MAWGRAKGGKKNSHERKRAGNTSLAPPPTHPEMHTRPGTQG
jgi:hypothetical protein